MNNFTLIYYDEHADAFSNSTKAVEFNQIQNHFLSYLKTGDAILDLGCGSGRDTKYFLQKGFDVSAIDGSSELANRASAFTGIQVRKLLFDELDDVERYDGIWACASLLHLPYDQLDSMLDRVARALKSRGIFYASFKYGTFEGERNGRYFTDLNEEKCKTLIYDNGQFCIENLWVTDDVRPEKGDEKWLNMILIKNSQNQK